MPAISMEKTLGFDDRNIRWYKLGDFEHFVYAMLEVDPERKIIDAVLKFEPNEKIFLHRHLALTNTMVLQGEHRIYEPDGTLKEIRPVGSYTSSLASRDAHREGGGPEGAVVFYSIRFDEETIFEILDDSQNVVGTLGLQDFTAVHQQQKEARLQERAVA
jgi:hypothetical protein